MKHATSEWIAKAEGDWQVACRELQAADPVWDAVCFHAQQCVEKYLKAVLEENGIGFARTHDLVILWRLLGGAVTGWSGVEQELAYLSPLGVAARYPGLTADANVASTACNIADRVRLLLRATLGLP